MITSTKKLESKITENHSDAERQFESLDQAIQKLQEQITKQEIDLKEQKLDKQIFEEYKLVTDEKIERNFASSEVRDNAVEEQIKEVNEKIDELISQCERRMKTDTKR